jgi:hypothetical protein
MTDTSNSYTSGYFDSNLNLPGFNSNFKNVFQPSFDSNSIPSFQWGLDNPLSATPYVPSSTPSTPPVAGKWWDQLGSNVNWNSIGSSLTSSLLNNWMNPMPSMAGLGQAFGALAGANNTASAANLTITGPFARMSMDLNREATAKSQTDNRDIFNPMGVQMANYLQKEGQKTDATKAAYAHGGNPFAGFRPRSQVIAEGYSNIMPSSPSASISTQFPRLFRSA